MSFNNLSDQQFEQHVARIYSLLEKNVDSIEWNKKLRDVDTGGSRQIDILLTKNKFRTLIECRLHKKKQDITWIEQIIAKKDSVNCNAAIAVSFSGFTSSAVKKARAQGIFVHDFRDLDDSEISRWATPRNIVVSFAQIDPLQLHLYLKNENVQKIPNQIQIEDIRVESEATDIALQSLKTSIDATLSKIETGQETRFQAKIDHGMFTISGIPVEKAILKGKARRLDINDRTVTTKSFGLANDLSDRKAYSQISERNLSQYIANKDGFLWALDVSNISPPKNSRFLHATLDGGEPVHLSNVDIIGLDSINSCEIDMKLVIEKIEHDQLSDFDDTAQEHSASKYQTPSPEPNPEITDDLVAEHGLNAEEYARVKEILGRAPNLVELGIFSVMWSEHCSYKSSKKWLKTLPTSGPQVIQGPGENAGVVDIGDGQAAVFKMESHNHPSFIEPYQGAATGVGGILRDVFTMGARPVANLNALRFGSPEHPKTRHLVSGVVAGIGGYGNCVGVPTVAGEVNFHPAYNGNILVNAMTVGLAEADRIFYARASGAGNPVIYVGSKTGRDGIHGATMASSSFEEDSEEKRPTVQVGDPFTEKLLIEACLELMATDAIVGIQDMGAAGLTSSSFEMASKGGAGVELDLDQVPVREAGMTAYEIMLSESQERMLMVLKPGREDEARAIFEKWDLDFAVVGHLTDSGRMAIRKNGEQVADLPIDPLAEAAPEYDRPWEPTPAQPGIAPDDVPDEDPCDALVRLMGSADLCSRRWIWEQYDHMVMADTVQRPGGDAAVVRVHGTDKGLAVTVDCTPRYVLADPVQGGRQAVAESWRNLTAVGATPLAVTDNMNFGNPEKPRVMGQFVGACQGMGEACTALDYPVVSGNVSLYNETGETAILPTPAIGGLGLLPDIARMTTIAFRAADEALVLIGETHGHLGQSLYLREIAGREEGAPPPVDLAAERRNGDLVRKLIRDGTVTACHDLSDGGLFVALAEMALAGELGCEIAAPDDVPPHAWLFGEDQARYLVTAPQAGAVLEAAQAAGVPASAIGRTGGDSLKLSDGRAISLADLRAVHEQWLPAYMQAEGEPAGARG